MYCRVTTVQTGMHGQTRPIPISLTIYISRVTTVQTIVLGLTRPIPLSLTIYISRVTTVQTGVIGLTRPIPVSLENNIMDVDQNNYPGIIIMELSQKQCLVILR
jgi:hypothetical protein